MVNVTQVKFRLFKNELENNQKEQSKHLPTDSEYSFFTTQELAMIYKLIAKAIVPKEDKKLFDEVMYKVDLGVRFDLSYYTPYDHKEGINYENRDQA